MAKMTYTEMLGQPRRKCSRAGCMNFSIYTVGARFWARGAADKNSPAEIDSTLTVCEAHKNISLEDVFDRRGREMIDRTFQGLGKSLPDWDTARLVFKPIKRGPGA